MSDEPELTGEAGPDDVPSDLSDDVPSDPSDDVVSDPSDDVLSDPSDDVLSGSSDEVPSDSSDDVPSDPSDAGAPVPDVDGDANDGVQATGGVDPDDQLRSVEGPQLPTFEDDVETGADGLGGADKPDARAIDFGGAAVPDEEPLGGDVRPEDLLDLRLDVWAELGRTELPAAEVVRLPQGAILELDRLPDDPADLFVNGMLLGRGRLIELDGEWAVRIESLELPSDAIEQASSEPSAG